MPPWGSHGPFGRGRIKDQDNNNMSKIKINIIGCGKLGKTIAKNLINSKEVSVCGIVNASLESAENAALFIGEGKAFPNIETLPLAEMYFITTPDDQIERMANQLATSALQKNAIIVHCSGALSSDILKAVKKHSCYIASFHPIKSFAGLPQNTSTFENVYCAMEGEDKALSQLTYLFNKIGARIFTIEKEQKNLYHAASVIANNYLITLHYHAVQCYLKANLDEKIANQLASTLINDALIHLKELPHESALTGPIKRGDMATLTSHQAAFKTAQLEPETETIYQVLGLATLALTKHKKAKKEALKEIFKISLSEQS